MVAKHTVDRAGNRRHPFIGFRIRHAGYWQVVHIIHEFATHGLVNHLRRGQALVGLPNHPGCTRKHTFASFANSAVNQISNFVVNRFNRFAGIERGGTHGLEWHVADGSVKFMHSRGGLRNGVTHKHQCAFQLLAGAGFFFFAHAVSPNRNSTVCFY